MVNRNAPKEQFNELEKIENIYSEIISKNEKAYKKQNCFSWKQFCFFMN